jgi:tryptophan synthase alpha chain
MTMRGPNRLADRLAALRAAGRKAFVSYLVAGYPDPDTSLDLMNRLVRSGVDVLEVGYPFSDPILDGPLIQEMNRAAVLGGGGLSAALDLCRRFRRGDRSTPLVLMGYADPIAVMGFRTFPGRAAAAGVDGLIVADMPLREAGTLLGPLAEAGLCLVPLSAPGLAPAEFTSASPAVGGFLYCIPVVGPTGGPSATKEETVAAIARCRAATSLPVLVGFGIRTPAASAEAAGRSDGIIVGSALLHAFNHAYRSAGPTAALDEIAERARDFRAALDGC